VDLLPSLPEKSLRQGGGVNLSTRITRILVIDDEAAMREVLDLRLREWGFDVYLAADGIEGKKMADLHDPDIVISDVSMPQVSGMDLLRVLKAGNRTAR
jgi:DNA-binding response OmpR family regulator